MSFQSFGTRTTLTKSARSENLKENSTEFTHEVQIMHHEEYHCEALEELFVIRKFNQKPALQTGDVKIEKVGNWKEGRFH